MKLGIKKVEIAAASSAQDWSFIPRNTQVKLSAFLSSALTQVLTVQTQAQFSAEWSTGETGQVCRIEMSGVNRSGAENAMSAMTDLMGKGIIAIVELVQGEKFVIGSAGYPARLETGYTLGGIKSKQLTWRITCVTPQGLLTVVS